MTQTVCNLRFLQQQSHEESQVQRQQHVSITFSYWIFSGEKYKFTVSVQIFLDTFETFWSKMHKNLQEVPIINRWLSLV